MVSSFRTIPSIMESRLPIYAQRFEALSLLGRGAFGEVYICLDLLQERCCALKLEPLTAMSPQLTDEAETLRALQRVVGVPALYWVGCEHGNRAIAMELVGHTLDQLLEECGGRFSLKTTLQVGDQMLQRLESLHTCEYIHRDIKPENFAIGKGITQDLVYLLDFGLAKKYSNCGRHIPPSEHRGMTGTIRYASINAHMGLELSRRDDLESLFYVLIFFAKGALPWQGVACASKHDKYRRVFEIKLNTPFDSLTKGLPAEFAAGLRYVRSLKFDAQPNYAYLRKVIRDGLTAVGDAGAGFDWRAGSPGSKFPGRKKEKSTAMVQRRRYSADRKSTGSQSTQSGHVPFLNVSVRAKVHQFHAGEPRSS